MRHALTRMLGRLLAGPDEPPAQGDAMPLRNVEGQRDAILSSVPPLPPQHRAVVLVAETLARCAPGLHRIRGPMDAVLLAREAVAALLLLPEGRELAREVLRTIPEETP